MKKWLFILLLLPWSAIAQNTWTVTAPAASITEAGNNYTPTSLESASNVSVFRITGNPFGNFTVQISRIDTDWSNQLTISARRTAVTGGTNMVGGVVYQPITTLPQFFFSGSFTTPNNRPEIAVQFRIDGVSVLLPVKSYTTRIVYTVSN